MSAIVLPELQNRPAGEPLSPRPEPRGESERWQTAVMEIGRKSLTSANSDSFFFTAARTAAQTLSAELAGAASLQPGAASLRVRLGAASGEAAGGAAQDTSLDPPSSPWALALREQRPLVIADLAGETRFDPGSLRSAGAAAGVICPLAYGTRPLGAIGVFSSQARGFAAPELEFLESIAVLLTSSAARQLAERALAEQTQFLSAAVDDREALLVVLSPSGVVEKLNDACRKMTGFPDDALRGKPFWESLLPAEHEDAVRDAFDRLRQGEAMVQMESGVRTKTGAERRVAWTFTIVQRDDGRLQSIVGRGGDVARPLAAAPDPAADKEQKNQAVLAALEQSLRAGPLAPRAVVDDLPELHAPAPTEPAPNDLRTLPRREYPYVQRIAPWSGGRLPSLKSFFDVRCRDISASGVSFYVPRQPDYDRFVIGLGQGENNVHVVAEVKHVRPFALEGHPLYLVGSQFLTRVYY